MGADLDFFRNELKKSKKQKAFVILNWFALN